MTSAPLGPDELRAAFRRVFPGVMFAMFLAAIDQTILASALPAIVASLGGFADLSWVVVAYLLAATVAAPLYGHIGDRFGRRATLLAALTVFTIASLACALAPTLWALILARALQGLGGGGLMTLSQALISENVPPRQRAQFQGYFAGVFAASSTLGPLLGALLTEHLSWRAVFFINLPLGVLAAVLALRIPYYPPMCPARSSSASACCRCCSRSPPRATASAGLIGGCTRCWRLRSAASSRLSFGKVGRPTRSFRCACSPRR